VTNIGMVRMGVGDHCIVDRFPGIDIEFTLCTVNAFVGKFEQRFFSHIE